MQDSTQQTPAVDPMATATTTPAPVVNDVTTQVSSTPADMAQQTVVTETSTATVTETPAQPAVGPAPVEVPAEVKVELPEVPAPATPVATETPVTPTV
jgi:hypothetical protein